MTGETARERQVREFDDLFLVAEDSLDKAYRMGWDRIWATRRTLGELHRRLLARVVREYVPDAKAIAIDATDQGGPGWVFQYAVATSRGRIPDGDDRVMALGDDDRIPALLSDLGEFMPSEHNPAQDYALDPPVEPTA